MVNKRYFYETTFVFVSIAIAGWSCSGKGGLPTKML